jgi:hypothetical protein
MGLSPIRLLYVEWVRAQSTTRVNVKIVDSIKFSHQTSAALELNLRRSGEALRGPYSTLGFSNQSQQWISNLLNLDNTELSCH